MVLGGGFSTFAVFVKHEKKHYVLHSKVFVIVLYFRISKECIGNYTIFYVLDALTTHFPYVSQDIELKRINCEQ